jgi:hypothetical protein
MQVRKVVVDAWETVKCPFCDATYEVRVEHPFGRRQVWFVLRQDADVDCRHRGIAVRNADGKFEIAFVKCD